MEYLFKSPLFGTVCVIFAIILIDLIRSTRIQHDIKQGIIDAYKEIKKHEESETEIPDEEKEWW